MLLLHRIAPVAVFFSMFLALGLGGALAADADQSQSLFTAYNIYYEKPQKISSVNYHIGGMIPVGSPVSSVRAKGKKIEFTYSGGQYTIEFGEKYHPGMRIDDFKNQLFTSVNPAEKIANLPTQEQEWVKSGTVQAGMSKEAVLLCWGPAPQHQTPNTSAPLWTYWRNRFVKTLISFDGEGRKVASVQ